MLADHLLLLKIAHSLWVFCVIFSIFTESFCGQRAEQERQAKEEIERQMEEERLQALEMERQKEEERLREEYELKEHLRQQMMELKNREAEVRYTKWKVKRDLCSVSIWK